MSASQPASPTPLTRGRGYSLCLSVSQSVRVALHRRDRHGIFSSHLSLSQPICRVNKLLTPARSCLGTAMALAYKVGTPTSGTFISPFIPSEDHIRPSKYQPTIAIRRHFHFHFHIASISLQFCLPASPV